LCGARVREKKSARCIPSARVFEVRMWNARGGWPKRKPHTMRARARRETEIDTRPENETEEKREEARLVVIAHRMAFVVVLVVLVLVCARSVSQSPKAGALVMKGEKKVTTGDHSWRPKRRRSLFLSTFRVGKKQRIFALYFIVDSPLLFKRGGGTFFGNNECYFWQHAREYPKKIKALCSLPFAFG
jgi:hypothetical protein